MITREELITSPEYHIERFKIEVFNALEGSCPDIFAEYRKWTRSDRFDFLGGFKLLEKVGKIATIEITDTKKHVEYDRGNGAMTIEERMIEAIKKHPRPENFISGGIVAMYAKMETYKVVKACDKMAKDGLLERKYMAYGNGSIGSDYGYKLP